MMIDVDVCVGDGKRVLIMACVKLLCIVDKLLPIP